MKVYQYKNCDSCKKALKYLDAKDVSYESLPIVDQPPTLTELKAMLGYLKAAGGSVKNLFNSSGVQYREMGMSQKLKDGMSESDALKILSENGKLIKRPFVLTKNNGVVGFKPEKLDQIL
ncbi:MAG: Spx/MgsR family RNA polymerase-binding regulatory protein [Bdellovibrionales bacterium]|nr:Spx/MgsR family RNA polymerase-binding regulatory protein [Bdellovibrionales bacterium]